MYREAVELVVGGMSHLSPPLWERVVGEAPLSVLVHHGTPLKQCVFHPRKRHIANAYTVYNIILVHRGRVLKNNASQKNNTFIFNATIEVN